MLEDDNLLLTILICGIGGFATGLIIGAMGEILAQKMENHHSDGSRRHDCFRLFAIFIRIAFTLTGAGLITAAILDQLIISFLATVCVNFMGVGMGGVGFFGLCYVLYRIFP